MRKSIAITAASALLGVAGFGLAQTAHADEDQAAPDKVWVCKYVSKPGEEEVLKEGKNPIHVSVNSLEGAEAGNVKVGDSFSDGQDLSKVVSLGEAEPDASICDDTTDPSEEPSTDPSEEPTADPSEEPTTEPTDDPTDPTTEPTDDPTDPAEEPSDDPADEPTDDDKGTDDSDRGVPATTGGNGDLGAIVLLGTVGAAASGGALMSSRRKR